MTFKSLESLQTRFVAFLEKYDSLVDFVWGNFNGGLPTGFDSLGIRQRGSLKALIFVNMGLVQPVTNVLER